jgi:chromosome segregation ATPase
VAGNSRRGVLRFLAGVGVGAGIVEVYERLYNMPLLEERFRAEVSYWINEYNMARERLNQLEQEYNSAKETITNLTNEYNLVRERINQLQEQHNSTLETISSMDRLEKESNQAILHYRERMDEAIKALRNTVEKYRVILGDERVSFESSTLKVLEDLKLSQEKLLKLLPYFPLIRDLSWRPSRVVNDKIYDIRVELEVISPLNTLAEVEVSLIPVEYEYFITRYGMRREDYPKAFPPEETKTIKLKPAGLERETST